MKITVAIDSFKGSLTTLQAGFAVCEGVTKVYKNAEVHVSPIADGGEGTVDAIVSANEGIMKRVPVHNPLGEMIEAEYGMVGNVAVIEMSAAAGITLIEEKDRNPLNTTTFGVGEMIKDAIKEGCRKFVIGIGGSATNDGGVGMLQALGFEFYDKDGNFVEYGAKGLKDIARIEKDNVSDVLGECSFSVACDVKNVLCGENGCSAVYGPQKGATPEMIREMDGWLKGYAEITKSIIPEADENAPGAGAAGGMGFALMAYLGAELKPGIELVMEQTGIEEQIKDSDYVITGEGRLDGQTYMGKTPVGVAKLAKKYKKPVIALSGCVTEGAELCNDHGIDAFFPILRVPCSLEEAMNTENAIKNIRDTAEQVMRLIKTIKKIVNNSDE